MARKNGAITGTWKSAGGGFKIFGAETIVFHGTDSTTNQNFTATYKGGTLGVGWSPVSVSGGKFTFNGSLDQFVGWSAGVSAAAGVHASYSMSIPSGNSLVMYGAETNVNVTLLGVGYTTLGAPIPGPSSPFCDAPGLPAGLTPPRHVNTDASVTFFYDVPGGNPYAGTGPNANAHVRTTVITSIDTGQRAALTTVVGGQVYPAGAVGVGMAMNGAEQVAYENHVRNSISAAHALSVGSSGNGYTPRSNGTPGNAIRSTVWHRLSGMALL